MVERDFSNGLRSPGVLGRKPMIGIFMVIIGSLIFAILALNLVYNGPLVKLDLAVTDIIHNFALNSPKFVTDIMIAGYYIGLEGIAISAILLGLYFLYRRFWQELVMVVVSLGLSGPLFLLLSNTFKRPRPFTLFDEQIWLGSPNIPGFPSGHTLSIIVLFGFLIYLFLPKIKSYLGKVLVITFGLLIIVYVGFSRLYVGDHYLTDVIAGYAAGIAWFGLVYTSVELMFKKSSDRFFKPQKLSKNF